MSVSRAPRKIKDRVPCLGGVTLVGSSGTEIGCDLFFVLNVLNMMMVLGRVFWGVFYQRKKKHQRICAHKNHTDPEGY